MTLKTKMIKGGGGVNIKKSKFWKKKDILEIWWIYSSYLSTKFGVNSRRGFWEKRAFARLVFKLNLKHYTGTGYLVVIECTCLKMGLAGTCRPYFGYLQNGQ